MKAITAVFAVFLSSSMFGQFQAVLSELSASTDHSAFAEISLVHRLRSGNNLVHTLGSSNLLIPRTFNGVELKMEYSRFRCTQGNAFTKDEDTFLPVQVYYDNETVEPQDDIFIASIPFPVDPGLIQSELVYYDGSALETQAFQALPKGEPVWRTYSFQKK